MKRLLYILLGLLAIIILAGIIIGMIAPTSFELKRSVTINQPAQLIWPYVSNLKMMDTWSPWTKKDPEMVNKFTGNDGQVGSVNYWNSEVVGEGEQEITKLDLYKRVETELRFMKPREDVNQAYIDLRPSGESTEVTWGLTGETPFPANVFMYFVDLEEMVGKEYEKGLTELKTLAEKR